MLMQLWVKKLLNRTMKIKFRQNRLPELSSQKLDSHSLTPRIFLLTPLYLRCLDGVTEPLCLPLAMKCMMSNWGEGGSAHASRQQRKCLVCFPSRRSLVTFRKFKVWWPSTSRYGDRNATEKREIWELKVLGSSFVLLNSSSCFPSSSSSSSPSFLSFGTCIYEALTTCLALC